MSDVQLQFQSIGQRLQHWLKLQDHQTKELEKLRSENEILRAKMQDQQETIANLQEQMEILKTAAGKMDNASKKAFEKRINQYIKDIDKVIAHLNS